MKINKTFDYMPLSIETFHYLLQCYERYSTKSEFDIRPYKIHEPSSRKLSNILYHKTSKLKLNTYKIHVSHTC